MKQMEKKFFSNFRNFYPKFSVNGNFGVEPDQQQLRGFQVNKNEALLITAVPRTQVRILSFLWRELGYLSL